MTTSSFNTCGEFFNLDKKYIAVMKSICNLNAWSLHFSHLSQYKAIISQPYQISYEGAHRYIVNTGSIYHDTWAHFLQVHWSRLEAGTNNSIQELCALFIPRVLLWFGDSEFNTHLSGLLHWHWGYNMPQCQWSNTGGYGKTLDILLTLMTRWFRSSKILSGPVSRNIFWCEILSVSL